MPQVNKIWVPVVPDARGFREDLKKTLAAVEKSVKLTIPLIFDDSKLREDVRVALSEVQAQADRSPVQAKVDVDAEHARREIDRLAKSEKATINADADTGRARLALAAAARPRVVEFFANVNKGSLAKAGTALAALSGLRVAGDAVRNIGDALSGLDRALPAIAGLGLAIGSFASLAISSAGGILTLGAALAPLAALAAPLPGLLLAGGIAVGVFAAAMADAGTQLGSLKPAFSSLQDSISGAFWAEAKKPIIDFVQAVLPSLKSGLTDVATSLGSWSSSVANSFKAAFSPEVIGVLTGGLSAAIIASTQGTDAFAASLATLGTFAAQYLPGIGNTFSDLSIRFNDFIQTVVSNGQLAGWVQEAGVVLGQLGAIFSNTFGILGNIADAAFAAGGSGLQTLAGALAAINQLTAGPAFQGALTTVFEGAAAGAAGLAAALGPIGEMFANLAPSISGALAGLGSTAGALLGGIADALNQPAVGAGLEAAVSGIAVGIQGILPSLPALGEAFGTLMSVVGQLASVIGPVLGAAFSVLGPVITSLGTALQPVIAALGPVLVQAISALAPAAAALAAAFMPLISTVLPVLMPLISSLVPVIGQIAAAFAPLIGAVLPVLNALLQALSPIFAAIAPIVSALIPVIVQIATVVSQVLVVAFQAITPIITAVISAVVPIIQSLATIISGVVNVISGVLTGNFSQAWQGAQQIVSGVWGVITGVINGARSIIAAVLVGIVSNVQNMASGIGSGISNAVSFFTSLPGRIAGALAGAGSWLVDVGRNIIEGLISGLRSMGSSILNAVTGPIKDAISGAKSLLGIHSPSRVFRDEIGKQMVAGYVLGITANQSAARAAVDDLVGYMPPAAVPTSSYAVDGTAAESAAPGGVNVPITINEVTDTIGTATAVARRITDLMI